MTDQLIAAWLLAADPDFGGSLDDDAPPALQPQLGRVSGSGIPYCYKIPGGWQVRIPRVKTRKFAADDLDGARAYVALHVEGV